MSTPSIALIPSGYKATKLYSQLPTNGDGDLTFARTSIATRVNEQGLIEEMGVNVPRLDYSDGGCPPVLLEPSRKNLFLNSEVGVTQTITVVSGVDYAVSFSGTGSITFNGGASGTLNGTGSTDRVNQIVTTSSTSVTCTISGTVEYVNFEINIDDSSVSYNTSWIETNGTIETRTADSASKSGLSNYINSSEGTFYFYGKTLANSNNNRFISLSDNSGGSNYVQIRVSTLSKLQCRIFKNNGGVGSAIDDNITNTLNYYKCAIVWNSTKFALFVNGSKIGEQLVDASLNSNILDTLTFNNEVVNGGSKFEGKVKDLRVYDTVLTDQELTELTTI